MRADELLPRVDLEAALWAVLRQVPAGRWTTYGSLARVLGDVRAARWVAAVLRTHCQRRDCVCQRVTRQPQRLPRGGGHHPGSLADSKRQEGAMRADDFGPSFAPLQRLKEAQDDIARRVSEAELREPPRYLCGLDVAYPNPHVGRAAAVLLDTASLRCVAGVAIEQPVEFPYVPGYLSSRELPLLLAAWEQLAVPAHSAVLCFVDGQGRLHPRRSGIACAFGVAAGQPTIGVGKSQLCGRLVRDPGLIAGDRPVVVASQPETGASTILAGVLESGHPSGRRLYISVGNAISLPQALDWAARTVRQGHLPEPIRLADHATRDRTLTVTRREMPARA